MKIKTKTQKKIILGILFAIFGLSAEVFSQYYYFDNGGKTYQQGCNETVDIRINSDGENVRVGSFHLILDPLTTIYPHTDDVETLRRDLVNPSANTFADWAAGSSPSWKSGSNYTILQIDRVNVSTDYNGTNGLFGTIKFVPIFSVSDYDIQFGMDYLPLTTGSESTIETTLGKVGGTELINPAQQLLHRTGTYQILKEPCIPDTNKPSISNLSITDGSSKKSNGDGLSFSLNDNGGVNGTTNVPYVFNAGAEWTGNAGGAISNQYGINQDSFQLTLSGNGQTKVITKTTPGVTIAWNGKTWQNLGLNANVTLTSQALFDFGIEKKITATFTFSDRAGNSQSYTINFNSPKGPTLISNSTSPAGGDVYVNLMEPIKLGIKDDWAGVDSGTIKIILSGVNGTDYGPYVFSGSDLNLSGVQGNANQPDYYINISNHEIFPTSGTIKVSVYAKDMEGNGGTISNYIFTTRPNCSEFQCCDPVLLDLGSGNTTYYTNTGLIISGGVNPTFSGDEQNITGVIDCNTENEGLSVYTGDDNFMFFTDESELTILGTGVKGVLSGNVLTLSYIIDSAEIIVDKPSSGQILTTGDVDIRWHLTGVDDEDDWLSGYYIEIYSGDTLITGGFVDGTGITESLSDGEYEFVVYPIDLGGHTGSAATGTFSIDTVVPSVVITGNDVGMCTTGGIYIVTGYFSEAVTGIDASTLTVTGGIIQNFTMVSGDTAVWTVSAGGNGGGESIVHDLGNGLIVTYHPEANVSYTLNSGFDTSGEFTAGLITITDGNEIYTIMDRNLGATSTGVDSSDSYGYYFQWGNNYGFPSDPNASITTSNEQVDASNYGPGNYYSSSTFITQSSWDNSANKNLRGGVSGTYEAMQGPCPEGYHVPNSGEWLGLSTMLGYNGSFSSVASQQAGNSLRNELYLPFAGYRNYSSAGVNGQGTYAYYWSSPAYSADYAYYLFFSSAGLYPQNGNSRSYGFSVRCFKNSPYSTSDLPGEGGDSSTGALVISIETGVFEDLAGNRNTTGTDELSWNYDGEGPGFVLEDAEIPECTDGTMTISGVTQVGCASGHVSPYSWDAGDTWGLTSTNTAYSGGIGEKIMTVRVRDAFGNYTEKTGKYTWTNVNPSVDDISVENVGLGTGINWRELSNAHEGECGTGTIGFSGFIDDGSHGTCTEEGGIITYAANTDTEYEGEDSCVFEITDDEGYTATGVITFTGIDTKKPTCEISYNENVCTSGDIALTMNATGAAEYSWNGFASMSSNNLSHNVHGNGVYTGYVRDSVGNTGICTVEVETFDDVLPIITVPAPAALTAEECSIIEGNIQVVDNGGCGNGFSYLWGGFGLGNDLSYSGYSEVVTGKTATVSVGDSAGNISSGTLNYSWTDTGVQLNSDEKIISDIVLTGGNSYNTTTGALISLFGAREGNCGAKYISVSKISCNGLSMDIDAEGNIVVTGNNNLTQTGSCELRFSDDDGNSENGTLKIRVDTVVPGVGIQGTNLACMSGSTFVVTGIFTEAVQGFDVGNIFVENGTPSSLAGNGSEYTWTVNMNPNVEVKVKVPAGAAFDLNGNPNTESNELTGMYDTAGPNKVILSERTKVYSETSKFTWQSVSDSGCAGVSGYIRELYEGSCEGTPKDSGITGSENFTVSGLENSGSYCRRVRSVDNFGNMGEWSDGDEFVVDLSDIGCDFDYVQACTNGTVQVTLIPGDPGYTDNGTVYLSWRETGHWQNVSGLTTGVTYSGQTLIGYIWQPATEKFSSCTFVASNLIDKENPEVDSIVVDSVPECTIGTATVTVLDEGCGQGTYTYNWNSNGYIESNSFQQYLSGYGTRTINLKVKDNAGNESSVTGVVFAWTDSPISGNNFTGHTGVGRTARTVNWREMSEVSDGDCGSGTITFSGFINSGTKGTCTRSGDEITYTPNQNESGDDSCTIQVKDDEGGTKDIVISWEGIDTKGPSCSVSKQPDACVSGSVAITLHSDEEISSAEGGDINRGIFGTNATGNVFANLSGNVVMSDLVGNTGVCEVVVNNINTGVLDAPVWLSSANGSNTNDNTLTLSWSGVSANGCRGVSGYEVQIIPSGGEAITGFTNINSWITPELPDGEYTIKVKTIDILGGESEWTEITITIDTEKPTCEIQYDSACVSGDVQLTMTTTGADLYSWIDFDNMTNSLSPNSVSSSGTYYCYVKDLAGNTGINSAEITNIKTGVLSAPSGLTIVGGTPTNDNTPEFIWETPESDGCREVSGYIVQILSGGTEFDSIEVDGTGWTSSELPDGEYTIVVKTEDSLSGESEGTEITFVIDRTPPNCSIEVMTENCTNSGVEIKLSGDISDILIYSWWNGATGNFGSDITTIVNGNGEYTGYVYDEAGNEGVCVGVVGTGIQDQILISYTTNDAEGFECEVITGSIVGNTGDSCGKNDLSKFIYSRPGGINTSEYGTSSNNVLSGFGIQVTIVDGAGNSNTDIVKYTWNDTGVTLSNGASQSIDDVLTGTFEKAVAEIVDLFGATEGACGTGNIIVTGTVCSGASMIEVDGNIIITPNENLNGDAGYCEFVFGDDEGQKTTTGRIKFMIDTIVPNIALTGTNLVCMNTNTFDVSGIFTEPVMGFESGDVIITGGIIQNFVGNGVEYTWQAVMDPMIETRLSIPAGVVTDLNGNPNIESNELTGLYDNVGPNDVTFVNWQSEVYLKNPTIFRSAVSDQGCAGLSGYNWVLSSGNSCDNVVNSGFTTDLFVNLDSLSDEATYTLCVQTVDDFGNTGNWVIGGFYVDLNAVGCTFEETACSNEGITLTLKPSNPDWTGIYLSWTGDGYREDESSLTQYIDEPGKTIVGYVYQTGDNPKQSSCIWTVKNIDQINPVIMSFTGMIIPECTTGTLNISANDEGCGRTGLYYSWDGGESILDSITYSLWSGKAGSRIVDIEVKDNVGNTVSGSATIEWIDSEISGKNITVENVGRGSGVNWRELSEVSDGACGSGTIEFSGFINNGINGNCTTGEGDIIVYVPVDGYTGSDSCVIEVKDDDGQIKEIIISWEGIDTENPSCNLTVQEGQSCTSGELTMTLSSVSSDVVEYSFDGIIWTINTTTGVNEIGIYTGYVKDSVGNTGICNLEITGGVLDLDEPELEVTNWIGYECSTGSITVTGIDNSCGINGLNYSWILFENITNTNEIYSGKVGSQTVDVIVYDGVGHNTGKQVTYIWQNVEVTGNSFTVENVGTGISVDWFVNGNVSGGICELDEIEATIKGSGSCGISGHDIIYIPSEGVVGGESCTVVITDGDEGEGTGIEIEITFTGVDTKKPTVLLQGGVGEQCTSENMFTVAGTFSEEVEGVAIDTLTGESVEIQGFNEIDEKTYEWTIRMLGGTGKVWINSGEVVDLVGNENEGSNELILGNYDNENPGAVNLSKPDPDWTSLSNSVSFEWSNSIKEGCAEVSGYILQLCDDELCESGVVSWSVVDTGKILGSLENGVRYWRVVSEDIYGRTGVSVIQSFVVDARNPNCYISEQEMCTQSGVQLILTGDRNFKILNSGGIEWNGTGMYYAGEVFDNENIIVIVEDMAVSGYIGQCEINVTMHDAEGPEVIEQTGNVNECEGTMIRVVANDTGCAGTVSGYNFGLEFGLGVWQESSGLLVTAEQIGRTGGLRTQAVTVVDTMGNENTATGYALNIVDVLPSLSTGEYNCGLTTGSITGLDIINLLGANEGNCGTGDLVVEFFGCTYANGVVEDGILTIEADRDIEENGECEIRIVDNEGNFVTGYIIYQIDTQAPGCIVWLSTDELTNSDVVTTLDCGGILGEDWFMINNLGSAEYVFENTGSFVFEYMDEHGNTGSTEITVTWIDKIKPECTGLNYSVIGGTSGNVTVTFDTESCTENITMLTGTEYEFTDNGEIVFMFMDDVGNTGELIAAVGSGEIAWIDREPPQCNVIISPDTWTNFGVTLSMDVLGDAIKYRWNEDAWSGENYLLEVEENDLYTGYVVDAVGNEGMCTGLVDKIDKQNPSITLEGIDISGCTNESTFEVIGTFDEYVVWFTEDEISIINGSISNFEEVEPGLVYDWTVIMSGGESSVFVEENVTDDRAGNENNGSNVLTSNYDNYGPVGVTMVRPSENSGINYGSTLILQWDDVEDIGCSLLSGYVYRVCEDIECNNVVVYGNTGSTGVIIEGLEAGNTYYWGIYPEDSLGNTGVEASGQIFVDLTRISCRFEETACSNTGIILSMFIEGSGTHLSWQETGDWQNVSGLSMNVMIPGYSITGYVWDAETDRTGQCNHIVAKIDQINPNIVSVFDATGYECEIITGGIDLVDEGCGSGLISYSWDGLDIINSAEYGVFYDLGNTGRIIYVTGYDRVGNSISTGVYFRWINSPITADNFTGSMNVGDTGQTVNWKEMSNVTDGACGNEKVDFIRVINSGSKGECTVSGDEITYIPYENSTGTDTCSIKVEDDEGDIGEIIIAWEGIDTEKPSCNLTLQGGQSCTSGEVSLILNSDSEDIIEYSFDGEIWNTLVSSAMLGVHTTGVYTGYVKDSAGNVSDACTIEVTGGVLDLDEPGLETTNWTGYECSTGSIAVTGIDNSCGINGLYYGWGGFENITNTNEIYSGKVGSQIVDVTVFDGVGHSITKQVTYTWQNVEVTGNSFTVENVGTGITIDWFESGSVSAGICEIEEITATTNDSGSCEISGHDIIYTPSEGIDGGESCTIIITDGDEGEGIGVQMEVIFTGIEIEITFTGVDTKRPTVSLQGGVGEQCTNKDIFVVTGMFSEEVEGVAIDTLTGENVEIQGLNEIDEKIYERTIKMLGGTGKVWINSGEVVDLVGNENEGSNELILGNYDNENPHGISLLLPGFGAEFNKRAIGFEWTASSDEGCAGLSGYILDICQDSNCNDVIETVLTNETGATVILRDNGDYYWTVTSIDAYGNEISQDIGYFVVDSNEPGCYITQSECSSSPVNLVLHGNKEIFVESGNLSWQQISQNTYSSEITDNIDVWAIIRDLDDQTGYCHLNITNYDNIGPDFDFDTMEVEEGKPLVINIVANDTGCAGVSGYIFGAEFGSGERQSSGILQISAEQIGNIGGIGKEQILTVIDNLGNITTKTGNIIIRDVKPTISETGTVDGIYTGELIVDVIDLLGAEEGDIGTGDLEVEISECVYATGHVLGQMLIVNVEDGAEGRGYCAVKIKDNEGSYSDVDGIIEFEVDNKAPECTGVVYDPSGWTSGDSVTVSLTGCSEPIASGNTSYTFTGNGNYVFELEDELGNTGLQLIHFTGFDREAPVFDFTNNSGYECQTGVIIISNAVDTGIGLANLPYSFDGVDRRTFNTKEIYSGGAGNIYISGYVRDGLGNYKVSQANYIINDSKPTATGFSVYALSGIEINWKELSNATDGACGSGKLTASISGGSAGTCSISGDLLIYEPDLNSVVLMNNYDLTIYDDEGSSVTVNVEFKGITSYPDVELVTPIDGLVLDPGKVRFAWKGQGNDDLIDTYVYSIWSSNDIYSIEQTGLDVSIDLKPGAYHWNVYAKYIDRTTGGLSDTYSFNVVPETSGLARDRCPYGDFSNSYYDGTCEATGSHGSADMCGVSSSNYSDEQKIAYLYAYSYGITTMCPIETAYLDGYLIRSHFAKMISEFAVNVLGKIPNKGKAGCDKFNDIENETDELKYFMKTACELELMGQESDGVTPAKSFNPNNYVTRAQFGTVLSRLLFGDVYNIKDESKVYMNEGFWYKDHLQALKEYGIMTKIDGDWPNSFERRGRVMLMLQRADEYGVFAGKIPAKNGVRALFYE